MWAQWENVVFHSFQRVKNTPSYGRQNLEVARLYYLLQGMLLSLGLQYASLKLHGFANIGKNGPISQGFSLRLPLHNRL